MVRRSPSPGSSEPEAPAVRSRRGRLAVRVALAATAAGLTFVLAWPWISRLRGQTHLKLQQQGELPQLADAPQVDLPEVDSAESAGVQPEAPGATVTAAQLDVPHAPHAASAYRLIAEEHAAQIFPIDAGFGTVDTFAGFRHAADLDHRRGFKEHPDGYWMLRTNSLGIREDRELTLEKAGLRVLVTGDSHTDGVCNNDEAFAHVLERSLAADGDAVEVLNAGKGGYTFYNYAGVLERFLALDPDVFVVTVYGGNDFEEALTVHYYLSEGERPSGARNYAAELKQAERIHRHALPQGILSYKYFAWNPDQIEVAQTTARAMTEHVLAVCESRGIRPIYVYLPPVFDVHPGDPHFRLELLCKALALEPQDLTSSDRLADDFFAWLDERGVETLDLRPLFREREERLYWVRDVHLDVSGHALVAEALAELLRR